MQPILTLHALFSDHAVLPRDVEIPIFGRSMPGQIVKVVLGGRQANAKTDVSGWWETRLEPLPAGGPHTLSVSTTSKQLFRRNILIGDVWLAGGQSNMEMALVQSAGGEDAIDAARYQKVRLFTVPQRGLLKPDVECEGKWVECTPDAARTFSAVAFHFGRTLHSAMGNPIGLVQATWGGTSAFAWTPGDVLRSRPEFAPFVKSIGTVQELTAPEVPVVHVDAGNTGEPRGWASTDFADSALPEAPVPGMWQSYGLNFNGAVWFRRWVDLPLSWASQRLRIELGAIDDHDRTYFNGVAIGGTGKETADSHRVPRRYVVPEQRVRPGRNLIAIRVFDSGGTGGFVGPATGMRLYPEGRPHEAIPLAGKWKIVVERQIPIPQRIVRSDRMPAQEYPSALFNGMISPLTRFPIRGVLWYQGESDVDRTYVYPGLFQALIQSWRAAWGIGDIPFLFVQLANYLARRDEPGEDTWAELREAQASALKLPATSMTVAADIGDADDIHPTEKRIVGERLALGALSVAYGRTMPCSGPSFDGSVIEQGAMRLRFKNMEGGLRLRPGYAMLQGFAMAGADRKFRWADARIEGESVVVHHPAITAPVAVRYGWEANPALSLENGIGLPAAPFRTDDWPTVSPSQ